MKGHVPLLRRRREGLTDYRARKRAITSLRTLLVVRASTKNVSAQFIQPKVGGDVVLSSAHSRELRKLGWEGPLKSTPACYLLGLHAGRKALQKEVKEATLYCGLSPFVKGSRVAALVKGVRDAGVKVPVSEEVLPSEERLTGKVIAEYASRLEKEDSQLYSRRFSQLLKRGFKPEDYPAHFEKVRSALIGGSAR